MLLSFSSTKLEQNPNQVQFALTLGKLFFFLIRTHPITVGVVLCARVSNFTVHAEKYAKRRGSIRSLTFTNRTRLTMIEKHTGET